MGLKLSLLVVPKVCSTTYQLPSDSNRGLRCSIRTVLPAKATLAPVLSLERSIELEAGAEMPDRMMLEHEATAEEMEA